MNGKHLLNLEIKHVAIVTEFIPNVLNVLVHINFNVYILKPELIYVVSKYVCKKKSECQESVLQSRGIMLNDALVTR